MEDKLWQFIDDRGTFVSLAADKVNSLYFPLCNSSPFMSSITPKLHGDIKTRNSSFLLEPVSRIDLCNSRSSRNFWVYINPKKIWSVTGVSKDIGMIKQDKFKLEAGLLWHKITRENQHIGLKAQITSFVPASGEPLEIMLVKLRNVTSKTIELTPTAAIPIYGRSADNLRDHRQVTSLLNRVELDKFGVIARPTLLFDETGHIKNRISYFVLGTGENGSAPEYICPSQERFCGDAGDLEAPDAVFHQRLPDNNRSIQGKEPIGALRFPAKSLKANDSCSYIIIMGIAGDKTRVKRIFNKFNTLQKIDASLRQTKEFWQEKSRQIKLQTRDKTFDQWFGWVNIQPTLRKIYGCSFLPDFDYGKGGRGWRDLWQDCLFLTLTAPEEARRLIINNFKGVRIDGSNATIIGTKAGEFIADRNNISRVWMDHGIWPWLTTLFYIHQSSGLKILLEKIPYFKDRQISRGRACDQHWAPDYGKELKTQNCSVYRGTVLEHILVENLVQFFNVGPHNHIRLENADWNDGLDMAAESGESVAFSAMYAWNLKTLAQAVEKLDQKEFTVLKELSILIDTQSRRPIDYSVGKEKILLLEQYFSSVKHEVSGKTVSIPAGALIEDLRRKADWLTQHIRAGEWIKPGFFNGYYDNAKNRVEGRAKGGLRMTLAGQVFPVLAEVSTKEQTKTLFTNAKRYLQDKTSRGFHLNTDFKEEQLNLGRAFSFVYGDKENGAFFNHMCVMFAYALYARGFAGEGFEVLDSIYKMSVNTAKSKIYPCLPEYFNADAQGMYSYLTGSASWFVLTLLQQCFGIKGEFGDLIIEPKLVKGQFKDKNVLIINTSFAGKDIEVRFINPKRKDFSDYAITSVRFNRNTISQNIKTPAFKLSRKNFSALATKKLNIIEVVLD